jgi:hypothetical protein
MVEVASCNLRVTPNSVQEEGEGSSSFRRTGEGRLVERQKKVLLVHTWTWSGLLLFTSAVGKGHTCTFLDGEGTSDDNDESVGTRRAYNKTNNPA